MRPDVVKVRNGLGKVRYRVGSEGTGYVLFRSRQAAERSASKTEMRLLKRKWKRIDDV